MSDSNSNIDIDIDQRLYVKKDKNGVEFLACTFTENGVKYRAIVFYPVEGCDKEPTARLLVKRC